MSTPETTTEMWALLRKVLQTLGKSVRCFPQRPRGGPPACRRCLAKWASLTQGWEPPTGAASQPGDFCLVVAQTDPTEILASVVAGRVGGGQTLL